MKIFLGSSTDAKSQSKAFINATTRWGVKFVPWWTAFKPGRTLIDELKRIKSEVDAAILLVSPDIKAKIRGKYHQIPNLNVLLEFGYFYSAFGKKKVAIVKYGSVYMPSDLGGYIHVTGSGGFTRNGVVAPGKRMKEEFERWVKGMR
jgi:predicted nucleotide-binding protein